jgi:hypothetical protein
MHEHAVARLRPDADGQGRRGPSVYMTVASGWLITSVVGSSTSLAFESSRLLCWHGVTGHGHTGSRGRS